MVQQIRDGISDILKRNCGCGIPSRVIRERQLRLIRNELAALLSEPRTNRAGETDIAGLVDELRTCHFVATNDTGTMHLAAALGVPTVAIFGSTEPDFTSPIGGDAHRVIRHKVDCSPCFKRECPIDYRCMLRIEPDLVTEKMASLLDDT